MTFNLSATAHNANEVPHPGGLFQFDLPMQAAEPRPAFAAPAPEQGSARRILIAEDVDINRELLKAVLEDQGHALTFAEDGIEAVDLVQQQAFDVVLMDIQMPRLDGVEATRRIRSLGGRYRDLPIVGLTATVTACELKRLEAAGVNGCLMKPIDWAELNAVLARTLPDESARRRCSADVEQLDLTSLETLARAFGVAETALLVEQGMRAYRRYYESIVRAASGIEGVRMDAHKLKGSAGTLGLRAVSEAAEAIELSFDGSDGANGRALVETLGETIHATQAALVGHGILPRPLFD